MKKQDEFLQFATSLKLIRKAEIEKDGKDIVNLIYTDLLPNNGILNQVNLPRTSILKGRKGTGKSTIFQKSMKDMIKNEEIITIYIDVKTLYDNATPTLNIDDEMIGIGEEYRKYFIYKNFLFEVIKKAQDNFKDSIAESTFKRKMQSIIRGEKEKISSKFDEMKDNIDKVVKQIDVSLLQAIKKEQEQKKDETRQVKGELSENPKLNVSAEHLSENKYKNAFETIVCQYFDIKKCLIDNFLELRDVLKVKYIYIYLDDYSEMDEEAQEIFMDWFVAPLNNSSEDFVKFKIATYPSRFYYGKLDNQKIDEINLDFYDALYSCKNITKMEEMSVLYMKRLIEKRFNVFLPGKKISDYFDLKEEELYELLFDMTLNIPRKLGFIFSYCYSTHIIMGKKITRAALESAAIRYFMEVTEQYFETNKYVTKAFEEMATRENLKCLMNKIIKKQIENDETVNKKEARGLPTSHFVIGNDLCRLVSTLELNGYISTYNKVNDKDNVPSTLYALDYGLCKKNGITFGRPKDTALRQYYLERKFLMNNIVKNHFNNSQVIECPNHHVFPYEEFDAINCFGMICPICAKEKKYVVCEVHVTNANIIETINLYNKNSMRLNDDLEYNILKYLFCNSEDTFSASQIADELDCTYQLVTKRADKLLQRELIYVDNKKQERRRYFQLTGYAKEMIEDINKV